MTVQAAIAIALAAAFGAYLGLLCVVAARRRRLRIEAVREALLRRQRRPAGIPAPAGLSRRDDGSVPDSLGLGQGQATR